MRAARSPVAVLVLAALLGGCHVVESKAWNLNEIHDETTKHRYTGALQGDTEYFLRHVLVGSLAVGGATFEQKEPEPIEDPAQACLENLVELGDFDPTHPETAAIQVEWYARIAVLDPWILSRERAVLGLGNAAKRLSAGVPVGLAKDAVPAGAQAASEALAGLVKAARPILERGSRASASERLDLDAACQVIADLVLDLDGARRLLRASAELAGAVGDRNEAGKPLLRLSEDLERRCILQALAKALVDKEPRVRAAAVEAAVLSAGPKVLDEFLLQLDRETSPEVLVRIADLVRENGLPTGVPPGTALSEEAVRDKRLEALMNLLVRPESSVRVGAMRALSRVSGAGMYSLREEDWQTWWLARPKVATPPTP